MEKKSVLFSSLKEESVIHFQKKKKKREECNLLYSLT